ncbi:hypothetical protein [Lactococcus cremoris]|uniref:hypothetical protein n=1 Tax=Lactococcus lactis subsp. cremoris TaxID=1359 RepID=UPI002914BB7B|nr:hypothetical protein [Lactococcus cremoris]MDU8932694.1 hypothetical protein [Lactococcus cremoris]
MGQKTTLSETQQQNISAVQNGLTELNQELQKNTIDPNLAANLFQNFGVLEPRLQIYASQWQSKQQLKYLRLFNTLTKSPETDIRNALDNSVGAGAVDDLVSLNENITGVKNSLTNLLPMLGKIADLKTLVPGASQTITDLSTGLNSVNSSLNSQILPGMNKLDSGLTTFNVTHSVDTKLSFWLYNS